MNKLAIMPVLLLASLQLNGAFSGLVQSGRQIAPIVHKIGRSAQTLRLPTTISKTCPAGSIRLLSSSRSQGGYGYAGGQQQANLGGREAVLLGCAALAGVAIATQDMQNKSREGHMLSRARCVYASENRIEDNPEVATTLKNLQGKYPKLKKGYSGQWEILETLEKHPESKEVLIQAIINNITGITIANYGSFDPVLQILKRFPESMALIIGAITNNENFANIVLDHSSHGQVHISDILDKFPEAKAPIIQATADNFVTLTRRDYYKSFNFIKGLLEEYPEDAAPIMDAFIDNLPLIKSSHIVLFAVTIMAAFPESRNKIVNTVIDNVPCSTEEDRYKSIFGKDYAYRNIMVDVLKKYPEEATPIIRFAFDRLMNTQLIGYDLLIIEEIMKNFPGERASLIAVINKNAAELAKTEAGNEILKFIQKKYPELAVSTTIK